MKAETRRKLERAGWQVGDAKDFVKLSSGEAEFVEIKLALTRLVRELPFRHR